jgi:acylphosphatase
MKKAVRLHITGSIQSMFFDLFMKEQAEKNNVKGFYRRLEDGRGEVFVEGNDENVDAMVNVCKQGPRHSQIRHVEQKEEKLQDFKDFRIIRF